MQNLSPLFGDANVWKQNGEEGGQLKLPTIRGWDLVILDPRRFIAIVRLIVFKD